MAGDWAQPYNTFFAFQPNDTTKVKDIVGQNDPPQALYIGGPGTLVVSSSSAGSDPGVPFAVALAGVILAISPGYVKATGTTCTGLVALYVR